MSLPSPTATEIWRPNKSNSCIPNYTPCGFLVKNNKCINPGCDYSHDTWRVRSWQNKHAAKPCRWGASCPHFMHGNCLYYHPPHHVRSEVNRDRVIKQDLQFVEHLDVDSLVAEKEVGISDKEDLASFNKISDDEIAVPGCPPRFHPITEPLSVTLDWHNPNLQPSFAKYTHTFEPLLRSIQATNPTFDVFQTADIVSNASNLRKLFHLFWNKKKITERFDLEWRRETLFLSKWTGDLSLRSSLGHGTGFEKETCRYAQDDHPLLRNSSSHHRVVWYSFGGLDFVIQSEVDGYYCECDHPRCVLEAVPSRAKKQHEGPQQLDQQQQQPLDIQTGKRHGRKHRRKSSSSASSSSTYLSQSPPLTRPSTRPKTTNNSPTSQFSRFSTLLSLEDPGDTSQFINQQEQAPPVPPSPEGSSSLKVHHLLPGRNIASACLIEVKTHKANNKPMFAPEAQLYFCRRTKLSVAQHKAGVFRPSSPTNPSSLPPSAVMTDIPAPVVTTGKEDTESSTNAGQTRNSNSAAGGANGNGSVQDKTEDLITWENDNQLALGKVAAFLRLLVGKMKDRAEYAKGGSRMSSGLQGGTRIGGGTVQGISIVIESDGKGTVKAGLYQRGVNGDGVQSLLPDDI
ncbi:hypothetical protein V8F06_004314 [Rhypophila decipiens]